MDNLLELIDSWASKKNLTKNELLIIIEQAVIDTWNYVYGEGYNITVKFINNDIKILKKTVVVEKVEDFKLETEGKNIGEEIIETFELFKLPRKAATFFSQQMEHLINKHNKKKEYDYFKDKIGEIINCIFIKNTPTDLVVNIAGIYKAIIPNNLKVNRERFKYGDKILARIHQVKSSDYSPQVILDRKTDKFVEKLIENYIPEIKNGIIEIKKIYRIPGKISKVIVNSDPANDAIGACVGVKGRKIKTVIDEMQAEVIDFIRWYDNPYYFIKSFLKKIPVLNFSENENNYRVVVADEFVTNAININLFNGVKILDDCLQKEVVFYSLTDYNAEQHKIIEEETVEICKFGKANPQEIYDLLLQYGNVESVILDNVNEEIKNTIQNYLKYLEKMELDYFVSSGGNPNLFKIVKELPSDIYFEFLNYNIYSIEDIQKFENATELSERTNIDLDACVLIIDAINELN